MGRRQWLVTPAEGAARAELCASWGWSWAVRASPPWRQKGQPGSGGGDFPNSKLLRKSFLSEKMSKE